MMMYVRPTVDYGVHRSRIIRLVAAGHGLLAPKLNAILKKKN